MKCAIIPFVLVLVSLISSPALALKGYVLAGDRWFDWGKLYIINCENGAKETVVDEDAWGACFNADGSMIAYNRKRGNKICVRSVNGNNEIEVAELRSSKGWELSVSWADDGYLYMSNWTKNVYRVPATGGNPEIAYSSNSTIVAGSASRDGKRYAATVPSWSVGSYDMENDREHNHGSGCQGSISSDGKWVSHNLDNHRTAHIREFLSNNTVYTISSPSGDFNMHRFSQHSPKHLCFTCNTNKGYVCDVTTGNSVNVGNCAPYDYFPGELNRNDATSIGELTIRESIKSKNSSANSSKNMIIMLNGRVLPKGFAANLPSIVILPQDIRQTTFFGRW